MIRNHLVFEKPSGLDTLQIEADGTNRYNSIVDKKILIGEGSLMLRGHLVERFWGCAMGFTILFGSVMPSKSSAADIPSLTVQFLGSGSPVAINPDGTVVGTRLLNGVTYQPLFSAGGATWELLPVPAGTTSVFPTDINSNGVIVGVAYDSQFNAVGVRWVRDPGIGIAPGPYTVEVLPRLPGDPSSYPTAVNDLGEIVGARRALGYVPAATTGWLFAPTNTVIDLFAEYGLATVPTAINANDKIISGTEVLDLVSDTTESVGASGPANYNPITCIDINNLGEIVGTASLRSTSLNVISVFRYTPGSGWTQIAGTSRYTVAYNINSRGDIAYGELGAGLFLNGLGTFGVGDLVDPVDVAAGWTITGSGCVINNSRVVAAVGRNLTTGQNGCVLLTPNGLLPTPSSPTNLQGVPHPSTSAEPFTSINLSWTNSSPLTRKYELERSPNGAADWLMLSLTPPGSGISHQDTTVQLGATYDYRVRAVGIAGAGPWSEVITVKAPNPPQPNVMTVSNVVLDGRALGPAAFIWGSVTVTNSGGPVNNARVSVLWKLPGGGTKTVTASTYGRGQASFLQFGSKGTYTLTVTNVAKSGQTFDPDGSVLSQTITK